MDKIYVTELDKPPLDENTLAHYGVLGMKWGVRKDPEKAWGKAQNELAKRKKRASITANKRIIRAGKKASRLQAKASKKTKRYIRQLKKPIRNIQKTQRLLVDKERAQQRADKAQSKLNKRITQGSKQNKRVTNWERQMQKTFSDEYINKLKKKKKK